MTFFTSRTSFATKMLAAIGLDLETLFKSGSVNALKEKFDAKTPATDKLDSVAKLFTAAGLNMDAMFAAGPDALKAHLASLSGSEAELAEAAKQITELEAAATTAAATLKTISDSRDGLAAVVESIGLTAASATTPEAAKTAFAAHVAKAANVELAKTGHPPIKEVPGNSEQGKKVMSRTAFNALTARAKSDFCIGGGKITE